MRSCPGQLKDPPEVSLAFATDSEAEGPQSPLSHSAGDVRPPGLLPWAQQWLSLCRALRIPDPSGVQWRSLSSSQGQAFCYLAGIGCPQPARKGPEPELVPPQRAEVMPAAGFIFAVDHKVHFHHLLLKAFSKLCCYEPSLQIPGAEQGAAPASDAVDFSLQPTGQGLGCPQKPSGSRQDSGQRQQGAPCGSPRAPGGTKLSPRLPLLEAVGTRGPASVPQFRSFCGATQHWRSAWAGLRALPVPPGAPLLVQPRCPASLLLWLLEGRPHTQSPLSRVSVDSTSPSPPGSVG